MALQTLLSALLAPGKLTSRGPRTKHNCRRVRATAFRELPREELRFAGIRRSDLKALRDEKTCDRWIVVTSIFQPSPATRKLGELTKQGWCYVVVADKNGPKDYDDVEGVAYLTVERQRALHFHIMDHLPWRHFGRKNVGFLYAIAHGAKIIYDTDDDNRLKEARIPILGLDDLGREDGLAINVSRPDVETLGHGLTAQPGLLNPYPSFRPTCGHIWPRGFPLDFVQSPQTFNRSLLPAQLSRPPAIQQFLADEDPDVDAIFRLTRPLPCSFQGLGPGEGRPQVVAVPPQFFTPYNAQCTVHLYVAWVARPGSFLGSAAPRDRARPRFGYLACLPDPEVAVGCGPGCDVHAVSCCT
ncbi:STL2 [Symbiodinium microadriaticum]|nr:STL2 [Symbiodinium microadriaticum]